MSISGHLTGRVQKVITPEFVARMRRRRPGYDSIYDLVQRYDDLPPDERMQMSESHLIESYIQPMFETLGWSVDREGHNIAIDERVFQIDLVLKYRDLRVPVKTEKPGDQHSSEAAGDSVREYALVSGMSWGILTDFETIRLWDLRDPNRPNLIIERIRGPTSPTTGKKTTCWQQRCSTKGLLSHRLRRSLRHSSQSQI